VDCLGASDAAQLLGAGAEAEPELSYASALPTTNTCAPRWLDMLCSVTIAETD
jgi:hypothetical protein